MADLSGSRRRFLRRVATTFGGLVGAVLTVLFLLPPQRERGEVLTVPAGDVPVDGALVYRESRVALVRDGEGIVAFSLVCTHLGCTLGVTADGLVCPCHGSRFDRSGAVLTGPATRALRRLPVRRAGDRLEVTLEPPWGGVA